MTLSAGLLLSIAFATLLEELVIGGLFRLFFAPRPENSNHASSRPEQRGPGRNR